MLLQPHVPQHVTSLLSHLTSRPGVQSTLILSRKDGSIIQCTGQLATSASSSAPNQHDIDSARPLASSTRAAATDDTTAAATSISPTAPADTSSSSDPVSATAPNNHHSSSASTEQPQLAHSSQAQTRYRPSQAEALAAHIYAFVSSASALSGTLSHPTGSQSGSRSQSPPGVRGYASRTTGLESNGTGAGGGEDSLDGRSYNGANEVGGVDGDADGDGREIKEEDDEVKLLRLRTKKHEIVVVPDRKYLLCVVHDAAGTAASGGGGTTGGGSVGVGGPGRRSSK